MTGWGDVRPLQTVNFETGDNEYSSYIFNNEITLTDGYKQSIYNELPEETVTDYKAASTEDKAINSAYIIVRKNEAEIESLANKIVEVSDTKTGTGSITLENAYEGQLYQLSIKGQISLLFPQSEEVYGYPLVPSDDLVPSDELTPSSPVPYQNEVNYPSSTLYSKSSNLIVDETKYKLDFDFLNYLDNEHYDEFIYDNGTCYIIRRVGIDENGDKYALNNEIVEPRKGVVINVKSNSTISLESFNNAILKASYLLENAYTDNFATQVEVQSEIKQTADTINLEVKKKLDSDEFTGGNIILQVNNDGSSAQINADKIDLAGKSINLTSDDITINSTNFNVDENGNLTANNGTLSNVNITSGIINLTSSENVPSITIIDDDVNSNELTLAPSMISMTNTDDGKQADFTLLQASGMTSMTLLSSWHPIEGYADYSNNISGSGYNYTINSTEYFSVNSSGQTYVRDGTYTSWSQASLLELKKNINKCNIKALDLINKADVHEFNYKEENDKDKKHIGFIIGSGYNTPEEFISNDGKGIDTSNVIGILVKAIQEQQAQIEELKKEMEELKNGKN